jgi:hypothetical protein
MLPHTPRIIVFDNTDRPRYQESIESLVRMGLVAVRFEGLAPGFTVESETTLLLRTDALEVVLAKPD